MSFSSNLTFNLLEADDAQIRSQILDALGKEKIALESIKCVGHRVVHGGAKFRQAVEIEQAVEEQIDQLRELAPVHNPIGLKLIRQAKQIFPAAKHIAVFDTAFHRTLEPKAYVYPLPYQWYEEMGIRRFGFHGINHQYCAETVAKMLPEAKKIVIAHLGNGCSLSAVHEGKSVDTSMGFTPNEGLMMGARSGSIDPGIIFYLIQEKKIDPDELEKQLNNKSGLTGVSGVGKDMREIEQAMEKGNQRARLAFDIFVQKVKTGIASMAAALNGIDALVFTAGIGEHSSAVRQEVCAGLSFLGLGLDQGRNRRCTADGIISSSESKVTVLRITAREDLQIYGECIRLL